jgi:hypothetical protein
MEVGEFVATVDVMNVAACLYPSCVLVVGAAPNVRKNLLNVSSHSP